MNKEFLLRVHSVEEISPVSTEPKVQMLGREPLDGRTFEDEDLWRAVTANNRLVSSKLSSENRSATKVVLNYLSQLASKFFPKNTTPSYENIDSPISSQEEIFIYELPKEDEPQKDDPKKHDLNCLTDSEGRPISKHNKITTTWEDCLSKVDTFCTRMWLQGSVWVESKIDKIKRDWNSVGTGLINSFYAALESPTAKVVFSTVDKSLEIRESEHEPLVAIVQHVVDQNTTNIKQDGRDLAAKFIRWVEQQSVDDLMYHTTTDDRLVTKPRVVEDRTITAIPTKSKRLRNRFMGAKIRHEPADISTKVNTLTRWRKDPATYVIAVMIKTMATEDTPRQRQAMDHRIEQILKDQFPYIREHRWEKIKAEAKFCAFIPDPTLDKLYLRKTTLKQGIVELCQDVMCSLIGLRPIERHVHLNQHCTSY